MELPTATPIVNGKMTLRNRDVETHVFWGARPALTSSRRKTSSQPEPSSDMAQMVSNHHGHHNLPQNTPKVIEYITLSDDDDEPSPPKRSCLNEERKPEFLLHQAPCPFPARYQQAEASVSALSVIPVIPPVLPTMPRVMIPKRTHQEAGGTIRSPMNTYDSHQRPQRRKKSPVRRVFVNPSTSQHGFRPEPHPNSTFRPLTYIEAKKAKQPVEVPGRGALRNPISQRPNVPIVIDLEDEPDIHEAEVPDRNSILVNLIQEEDFPVLQAEAPADPEVAPEPVVQAETPEEPQEHQSEQQLESPEPELMPELVPVETDSPAEYDEICQQPLEQEQIPEDPTAPIEVSLAESSVETPSSLTMIDAPPTHQQDEAPIIQQQDEAPPTLQQEEALPTQSVDEAPPTQPMAPPTQSMDEALPIQQAPAKPLSQVIAKAASHGVRKSRRINKEPEKIDNEVVSNFNNGVGIINRGTTVPIGLTRIPFHFKEKAADERTERIKDQLKIDMRPVFTPAGPLAQGFPAESQIQKRGIRGSPEPLASEREYTPMSKEHGVIRVGAHFQAVLDDEVLTTDPEEDPIRDEPMWSSPKGGTDEEYDTVRNVYWRAIWRQFEGHIPMEYALQTLMKCGYSFGKALNAVDQNLKILPQAFKPPCVAQVKLFNHLLTDKKMTRRKLQEKAMRNYHIGEVQQYHYRFRKYYKYQEKHKLRCNCYEPLCKTLEFEPRWACSNCTKGSRELSADLPIDEKKLCLICQTFHDFAGRYPNVAEVVFNDEEREKIQEWNEMEMAEKRLIPREEFEQKSMERKREKWRRNELTVEETSMLNKKELKMSTRKQKTEEEKKVYGEKVAAQLEPFVLPLFTKCRCKVRRDPLEGSPNEFKLSFTLEEQELYMKMLKKYGHIKRAAKAIGVESIIVHRFIKIHDNSTLISSFFKNGRIPRYFAPSANLPPIDLPPIIPDVTSSSSSRDGSPYIPPEERERSNRRRRQH